MKATSPEKKINNILVPLDHTNITKELVALAVDWQKKTDAQLHFLHVGMSGGISHPGQEQAFEEYLKNLGGLPEFEVLYRQGKPTLEIIKAANWINADMVIMGAHNHSAINRLFLGSNTDYVIHRSPCPVFVHKKREKDFENLIIVPVDYTTVNKVVVGLADQTAQAQGAELLFLHVAPNPEPFDYFSLGSNLNEEMLKGIQDNYNRELETSEQREREILLRFVDSCNIKSKYTCINSTGKPYEKILEVQKQKNAGLIAMAAHSHSRVDRILNGSNTNYLLHHVECSMLVYKEVAVYNESPQG